MQLFEEARRMVRWNYQWIILNEFLLLTIGQDRVDEILRRGNRFYRVNDRRADGQYRNVQKDPPHPRRICRGRLPLRALATGP